ncbi:MAG: hypothetical protein ACXWCW_28170, partial [Burkholderiales bacterium]
MQLHRLFRFAIAFPILCTLAATTGCERKAPATRSDTTAQHIDTIADSTAAPAVSSGWNDAAGPVLLVQGETRDEAIVLLPEEDDSAVTAHLGVLGSQGASVSLFGRGGARLAGQLGAAPAAPDPECRVLP